MYKYYEAQLFIIMWKLCEYCVELSENCGELCGNILLHTCVTSIVTDVCNREVCKKFNIRSKM